MADSPPLPPIPLDPNLQLISPHVPNSTTATAPLRIISPPNWFQSPTPIGGQTLQLAIIPPSVHTSSWNLPRSDSLTHQIQFSDSPSKTMHDISNLPSDSTAQKHQSSDQPKKKRRSGLNSEGKSAIVLIIEWLGTATTTGTCYDWWKGEMDVDTRTIHSKKEVGKMIAEYLAEQGLPGRDGKGVETQIRNLQFSFTLAQDFRNGTGQGVLVDLEQQAREEKAEKGYLSDSDEWKALKHSTESKFNNLTDLSRGVSPSQTQRPSPTPNISAKSLSGYQTPGQPVKRPRPLHLDNHQGSGSTSSSASDVHHLLASQLPSHEEKVERNKLEKDRFTAEENFMKAEQDARQEELKTQAKLVDAISRHLSGGEVGLEDSAARAAHAQLKLDQDRVALDLARSQLACSHEDLITARIDRKLSMLAKYKALGLSMEEAKKEVEEAEEQLRRSLEGELLEKK
ncbi:hypothetical protein DFH28DRAFT_1122853 [Melampsora americana]|nr:hypothetical protein DFH28DRAFT_1122853 [Melampsora americana]